MIRLIRLIRLIRSQARRRLAVFAHSFILFLGHYIAFNCFYGRLPRIQSRYALPFSHRSTVSPYARKHAGSTLLLGIG